MRVPLVVDSSLWLTAVGYVDEIPPSMDLRKSREREQYTKIRQKSETHIMLRASDEMNESL